MVLVVTNLILASIWIALQDHVVYYIEMKYSPSFIIWLHLDDGQIPFHFLTVTGHIGKSSGCALGLPYPKSKRKKIGRRCLSWLSIRMQVGFLYQAYVFPAPNSVQTLRITQLACVYVHPLSPQKGKSRKRYAHMLLPYWEIVFLPFVYPTPYHHYQYCCRPKSICVLSVLCL